MSNIRDSTFSTSNRFRRTPPDANAQSGVYNPAQSARTVLPPLSSAFAGHYSDVQHDPMPSRMSPNREEVFSPSFPPAYWPNNGHTTMAGHPPYNTYSPFEHFDMRHQTQTPAYPLRQSPAIPSHQETLRRAPPITIPQAPPREVPWSNDYINPSFPSNFGLNTVGPDATGIHSNNYPSNYDTAYHSNAHQNTYPSFHSNIDTRHHIHPPPHPMHFPPDIHQPPHRNSHPSEWVGSQRIESHLVSPYARTQREPSHPSPQEPSPVDFPTVKKKRKRADAAQLKVLNEVYARTAFPTTEERLELANRLDMSARSVQIWFQNKRQATRQSRQSTNSLPPVMHQQYAGGPSSASGPSPMPRTGRSGTEVSVSPSSHGGSYAASSSTPGSHRSQREISPHPVLPSDAVRRARSPEGNGRTRRQPGPGY